MARTRIDQYDLQPPQWAAFIAAVKTLKAQTTHPNYDDFAMAHMHGEHMGQAHLRYTFLPWHREYLFKFEDALRAIDPTVTIPYWDWTRHPALPEPLADADEWDVTRAMHSGDEIAPQRTDEVTNALAGETYPLFHMRLNLPHGEVHVQIGGQDAFGDPLGEMADIEKSPRDVLFWLHHAFLDKVWADWSATHPGLTPPDGAGALTNINARLLPESVFTRTSVQTFSLEAMGYDYQ